MYLSFFGLREKPFGPTPDPRFLYLTPGHREALAQLVYGVQEGAGFVVLTGEVGTGKTTLVQALCRRFDSQTTVAFVVNSTLSFDELLDCALQDFGIKTTGATRSQRLIALKEFLLARDRADERAVLILDEAQNFSVQTLEGIRLLTNFETTTRKLLQVILVGQPEFAAKLALPQLPPAPPAGEHSMSDRTPHAAGNRPIHPVASPRGWRPGCTVVQRPSHQANRRGIRWCAPARESTVRPLSGDRLCGAASPD